MTFWKSLSEVFGAAWPNLRAAAHSNTLQRVLGVPSTCARFSSQSNGEGNANENLFFDEESMKILRTKNRIDPRDVPVFKQATEESTIKSHGNGDIPTSNQQQPAEDVKDSGPSSHRSRPLPIVRMRLKNQWYQKLPIIHIKATYNNTLFSITDHNGQVLAWTSAGSVGFKNARRGTTFAAQSAAMTAAEKARELGFQKVQVRIKGPGHGRQPSIKGLESGGLQIVSIQDVTPVPHNGCRPRKARRL